MTKTLTTLACLLSCLVQAAPRRMVVASGECKDAELSSQAKAFQDALTARPDQDVLSLTAFGERLFPPPSKSFEDLQRLLDAAQNQFYEARHAKAEQALDDALQEISRLPVGEARWQLYTRAQLLHALNYRAMGKGKESDTAFRAVLRLKPQHKLDPALYPPSIRQAFEKVRADVTQARKVKLSVKSTLPASDVYLDGLKVGQTPLTVEVLAGTYELTLMKGAAVSFPRQLPVQGTDTPILIDLAYEGSVSPTPFPCLASSDKSDERTLSHAVRLGGTLGVEEVIVVRLERSSSVGPKWFAATVLNVEGGQKVREGGFKTQGLEAPREALSGLVDFVTTGKAPPHLVVPSPHGQAPWDSPRSATDAPLASGSPPDLEVSTPHPLSEGGALTTSAPPPSGSTPALRVASYVLLGTGVAALGGAGVVRLMAQKDLDALEERRDASGRISSDDAEALALRDSLQSKNHLLTGLLIGSGAALTSGAVLFLVSPSQRTPPPVSVGVSAGPQGASATVSGAF